MARETVSEKLVRKANAYYWKQSKAKITKNEPHTKLINRGGNRQLMFASSGGLDYSGVVEGGKYVSFEVKETERSVLPIDNIRTGQIETMRKELSIGGDSFLLVYFKNLDEWYRLDYKYLIDVLDRDFAAAPVRYFRAFGLMIPCHKGFPEYLSPEGYPMSNHLKDGYPEWMPKRRKRRPPPQMPKIDHLDMDARKRRITQAISQGIKNAERREQQVAIFKRSSSNDRSERSDS